MSLVILLAVAIVPPFLLFTILGTPVFVLVIAGIGTIFNVWFGLWLAKRVLAQKRRTLKR